MGMAAWNDATGEWRGKDVPVSGAFEQKGPQIEVKAAAGTWDARLDAVAVDSNQLVRGLKCGVFKPIDLQDGDTYFELIGATFVDEEEARGRNVIVVDVLGEDGNRLQGARVWHGWPTHRYPQYDERVQLTVFGSVLAEWSLYASFDAWKNPGPYWVQCADGKSDTFWGAGLPWNHHVCFFVVFQRKIYRSTPTYTTLVEAMKATAQAKQVIQFNPTASLQKRIFADGFVPNSPEFDVVFDGQTYRGQRAEHLQTGTVRAYYCKVGDWQNMRFVEW